MIKFSNTVIYVDDVEKAVDFYKKTMGLEVKFITEDKEFAELKTGETMFSFASHTLAKNNFEEDYVSVTDSKIPLGIEITFVTDNIKEVHSKALENGAKELREPHQKTWGQYISHFRCPAGILIELSS